MPNWAEMYEKSPTEKATHAQVDYEKGTDAEHCGNCKNFIPEVLGNRCRTVECPIAESAWCKRWKRN